MKKKKDKSPVDTYLDKRSDMTDEELEQKIKNMTEEDMVRTFLTMLREETNRATYLFQYINEVVNSSAVMGREGYQPIAMFTLYARESEGVTELKFRPARTGSEEVYRNLKLERLFELVNNAWVQHGNEVFGGFTEETRVDKSALNAWTKAVEDQEKKKPQ